jgi:cytochrome oxidase Cu insertion factor (SCO1/SenC/PrrC family)
MRRLLAACAVLAAFAAASTEPPRREGAAKLMQELMSGKVAVGGDFTLTDARGRRVSLKDFRGKLVLLYFGFATCPDVCPTDLQAIGRAIRALGPAGDRIQPVFVTLDPARDTREVIEAYAAAFHPRFVALTGSEGAIRRVASAYKVFYEKVPLQGALGYTIDHAAFTYVIDTQGRYVGIYPPGTPADRMESLLREELQSSIGDNARK